MPGSGKSFAAKRELVNVFLATRDRIIVVDPMGEYSPLIKRLGGQVIEIAPDSPHHINPMDIDLSFDEENPMAIVRSPAPSFFKSRHTRRRFKSTLVSWLNTLREPDT